MQWMLGESVLVSPVITPNTTTITPYFTKASMCRRTLLCSLTHCVPVCALFYVTPAANGQHVAATWTWGAATSRCMLGLAVTQPHALEELHLKRYGRHALPRSPPI